jgi:hypothetical protein
MSFGGPHRLPSCLTVWRFLRTASLPVPSDTYRLLPGYSMRLERNLTGPKARLYKIHRPVGEGQQLVVIAEPTFSSDQRASPRGIKAAGSSSSRGYKGPSPINGHLPATEGRPLQFSKDRTPAHAGRFYPVLDPASR